MGSDDTNLPQRVCFFLAQRCTITFQDSVLNTPPTGFRVLGCHDGLPELLLQSVPVLKRWVASSSSHRLHLISGFVSRTKMIRLCVLKAFKAASRKNCLNSSVFESPSILGCTVRASPFEMGFQSLRLAGNGVWVGSRRLFCFVWQHSNNSKSKGVFKLLAIAPRPNRGTLLDCNELAEMKPPHVKPTHVHVARFACGCVACVVLDLDLRGRFVCA